MLDLSKTIKAHCHIIQEVDASWYEKRYISKSLLRFLISLPAQFIYGAVGSIQGFPVAN